MQGEPPGWDALSVNYQYDLTTKLTVLYLTVSILVFVILAIRSLPILRRLKLSAATLRAQKPTSSDTDDQQMHAANPALQRFRIACVAIQSVLVDLGRWVQLTMLILLAYSATEIADELRRISMYKMTGIGALSGLLGQICSMWVVALWFIVVLCIASWILSDRLARCADLRADSAH